jgi:Oxidoreductase NAD-binding domain
MTILFPPGFVLSTVPRRKLPTPSGAEVGTALGAVVAVGCGVCVASGVTVLSAVAVAPLCAKAPTTGDVGCQTVPAPNTAAMPPMKIAPIIARPTPRETLYRSYSLCGDGDPSQPWELTIKRMQMDTVSNYFYQSVQQVTLLYASLPRGTFTLPGRLSPEMAFVFVGTGSGITPLIGMLRSIRRLPEQERPLVQLAYASRTPDDIIYRDELDKMDPDRIWLWQLHYVSSEGYRMTADDILDYAGSTGVRAH